MRKRLLRKLLLGVCPILTELGAQYWADFGTLLGMHREHDIIVYDNDADVVVLNPNWDQLFSELKQRLPFCR